MQDYSELKGRIEQAMAKLDMTDTFTERQLQIHADVVTGLVEHLSQRYDAHKAVELEARVKLILDVVRAAEMDHVTDPRRLAFKLVSWAQFLTPTNGGVTGLLDQYFSLWAARLAETVMAEYWTE